jgi:hypothetical protein
MRRHVLAGIGGIGFSVLTIIALLVASPPGGSYSASDATKYVAKGHHLAVFVSVYLLALALFVLLCLLAYLRDVTLTGSPWTARIFWGSSVAAIGAIATGWSVMLGDAIAHAYGGSGVVIPPAVTYLVSQIGSTAVWGLGGILLGFALITLTFGSGLTLPAWLRWSTSVAGVGAVASLAFFPSALVILWGIVIGVWLLVAGPRLESTAPPAPSR